MVENILLDADSHVSEPMNVILDFGANESLRELRWSR